ncbi:hypothetical protein M8T05_11230 [Enterobacter roggenkampii]|uniref:hypothetical protein n=1 Tax=Enterobacter roggenkampii TaxID=1812935 RepID=UPI00207650CA|nr:hypothetical protein [Enterobacter roggenkampii]MCM7637620.1 hypothetical protein [Enterobacter roggenkampii]MCM7755403.1 hypothetical protein [Enterobacter roggenkampii]
MDFYAVVENGIVINVVIWDGESGWVPEEGYVVKADDSVGIGWVYDGKGFTPPITENIQPG